MPKLQRTIYLILSVIACFLPMQAFAQGMQASLITCYPGPEVYELVGHEAIRIQGVNPAGEPIDSVWNYGVFDFNSPGFIYRFVKGETDYMVWGYPYTWFIPQYLQRGSKVVEQDLNFNEEETLDLLLRLRQNALPQNRSYRYNYVRDNCSTRIAVMLDSAAAPRRIIYPDSVVYTSFRQAMRSYHHNYPWYQFGIDLALGSGIDMPITSREEFFAPIRFMELAAGAHFADDGEPLVKNTLLLNEGVESAILPATPWYETPLAIMLAVMLVSFGICIYEWKVKRIVRWWMTLYFSILGLAGALIWFLVFISTHDSTSPNLLFVWLTPLQLIIGLGVWWRWSRPLAVAMAVVDIAVILILACVWAFQPQSANPAIFPLWAATLALSALYVRLYPYERFRRRDAERPFTPSSGSSRIHVKRGIRRYHSK